MTKALRTPDYLGHITLREGLEQAYAAYLNGQVKGA